MPSANADLSGTLGCQSCRKMAGLYVAPEIEVRIFKRSKEIDRFADSVPEGASDLANIDAPRTNRWV